MTQAPDAVVVGSGPNGLAAAIRLAEKGLRVRVYEAEPTWGGGLRSAALTAPGFVHDVCASVFAVTALSPYFRTLPLDRYGVEFVHPETPFAHPLDDGTAVVAERSIDATADSLDPDDRRAYRNLFAPYLARARSALRLAHGVGLRAVQACASVAGGLLRPEGDAVRVGFCAAEVPWRPGPRVVRRGGGARVAPARANRNGGVRPQSRVVRARGRVAHCTRRIATRRRRAGRAPASAWRRGGGGPARDVARSVAGLALRVV